MIHSDKANQLLDLTGGDRSVRCTNASDGRQYTTQSRSPGLCGQKNTGASPGGCCPSIRSPQFLFARCEKELPGGARRRMTEGQAMAYRRCLTARQLRGFRLERSFGLAQKNLGGVRACRKCSGHTSNSAELMTISRLNHEETHRGVPRCTRLWEDSGDSAWDCCMDARECKACQGRR